MPFHDSYIFFGFCVVSFKGVELDIEQVKAILEWLELTDVHEAHALKDKSRSCCQRDLFKKVLDHVLF